MTDKPDALTVRPGQAVSYHNEPGLKNWYKTPNLPEDQLDELLQRVMVAADSQDENAVAKVLTSLLVGSLSSHDLASVCGCLVGLLDGRAK